MIARLVARFAERLLVVAKIAAKARPMPRLLPGLIFA